MRKGRAAVVDRNYRDIMAGVLLTLAGSAAALYALSHYALGTINRMGPGMMPVSLGVILAVFGLAIAIPAIVQPGESMVFRFRPFLFLSAAVLAFALVIERFGLVPAVFATTVVATLAEVKLTAVQAALLGAAMALMTWAIFLAGLGLTIPAFDWSV